MTFDQWRDTTPAPIGAPVPRYKIGYQSDEWWYRCRCR